MTDNEAKIRMLLDELADGYRRKDAAQIVSTYALEIRKFDLQPPLQIRRGETSDIGGGHLADVTSQRAWRPGSPASAISPSSTKLATSTSPSAAMSPTRAV